MSRIQIDRNVDIPMRDGTLLRADIYRNPDAGPSPALLQRTPYSKDGQALLINPLHAVPAGYAIVRQDVRGTGHSEGEFYPMRAEAEDGFDTIAWLAAQEWCDGNVGMFSVSYEAISQWLAAGTRPPALRAIAPMMAPLTPYDGFCYRGGAFHLGLLLPWALMLSLPGVLRRAETGELEQAAAEAVTHALLDLPKQYAMRPIKEHPQLARHAPWYVEMLEHPAYDSYWKALSNGEWEEEPDLPVFQIGGWFDVFAGGTMDNYALLRKKRKADYSNCLLMGAWAHNNMTGRFPDCYFGTASGVEAAGVEASLLAFFGHWLRGEKAPEYSPVRVFVMGENRWESLESWPPEGVLEKTLHLCSGGSARSIAGSGRLAGSPDGAEYDSYVHDPDHPLPSVGGHSLLQDAPAGPIDLSQLHNREDMLCYTAETLDAPLCVMGDPYLTLFASTSARDTDWIVRLVDIYPDGRALPVTEGILRARYRDSFEAPSEVEPGRVYPYRIRLWTTAYTFMEGHRLCLQICSSQFPRLDVNTGLGGDYASVVDVIRAENRVYHTKDMPSVLNLPVRLR